MRPLAKFSRKEKQAVILSVVMLFGIGGFCYVTADTMEVAEPAVPVRVSQTDSEAKVAATDKTKENTEVPANRELRDPFSPLHETRGEAAVAEQAKVVVPKETNDLPMSTVVETVASNVQTESKLPAVAEASVTLPNVEEEKPVLCGVIKGNGEKLALLRLGTQTRSVGIGEWLGDFEVVAIFAERVCLQRNGEQQWLSLQSF